MPYRLDRFLETFDDWVAREAPASHLRRAVLIWFMSRGEQPYEGVNRAEGFDNLWYGVIPGSFHSGSMVVVCSYWIVESERTLRCDSVAILGLPCEPALTMSLRPIPG
jgi:hypothetical protein